MTAARRRTGAALAAAVLLASGCGGSEENRVEDAYRDFAEAVDDGDAAEACDLLTSEDLQKIEDLGAAQGGCEATLEQAGDALTDQIPDPGDVEVENVEIDGDTATADVNGQTTLFAREDGDWKVSP